jgi:hypothetical protein
MKPRVAARPASRSASSLPHPRLRVLLDEMLAASGGRLTATERRAADRALGIERLDPRADLIVV